ncbi:MAG: acyltransferase family protein [Actinomycetes bacterium]
MSGAVGTEDGQNERSAGLPYRPALDGVRALAVAAVVAYHLDGTGLRGGFLGVDTFFVLWGFLITTLCLLELKQRRGIGLIAFWGRRLRRLLPALLAVIAAVAVYAWVAASPEQYAVLRGDSFAGLLYVANWRFVASGQSYFDLFSPPSPLRHLWSLAIEEQFYLVWPLVVAGVFLVARRIRPTRAVLAVVAGGGAVASAWTMARLYSGDDPSRAYYGTDARAHTILIGCLMAVVLLHWRPRSRVATGALQAIGALALGAVLLAFVTVSDRGEWLYRGGSVAFSVAAALLVLAAAQPRGALVSVLAVAPLRALGRISYGVYLWHWPIIVWMTPERTQLDGLSLLVARTAMTLGVALLSYHLLEMPIRRGVARGAWGAVLAPVAIAATVVAVIASTASPVPPPAYLGGNAGRLSFAMPCPAPTEQELARASRFARPALDAARGERSGLPGSVVVLGDSVACSLMVGLRAVRPASMRIGDATVIGCGVVAGRVVSEHLRMPRYQGRCARYERQAAARAGDALGVRPEAVLWLSTWEQLDLVVGRRILRAGTKGWERTLASRIDRVVDRYAARGSHVFLTLPAPATEGRFIGNVVRTDPALDLATVRLADFLERFAATRRDRVSTIDLASFVCPSGPPCTPTVAGRQLRPTDGNHFSPEGAAQVARWLLPQLRVARDDALARGSG